MSISPESLPHLPQAWQGDSRERRVKDIPHAKEVVAVVMAVGFDTLGGSSKPPSEAIADFASALQVYELGRITDTPDTVVQRIVDESATPEQSGFLRQAFEVMEAAHACGANTREITAELLDQSARFADIERQIAVDAEFNGGHADQAWQHGLEQVLPAVTEE